MRRKRWLRRRRYLKETAKLFAPHDCLFDYHRPITPAKRITGWYGLTIAASSLSHKRIDFHSAYQNYSSTRTRSLPSAAVMSENKNPAQRVKSWTSHRINPDERSHVTTLSQCVRSISRLIRRRCSDDKLQAMVEE